MFDLAARKNKRALERLRLIIGDSDMTTDPRNWSRRRWSKPSLRTSPRDSPAGFALAASLNRAQCADNYA
jgi:hypothetical protein